MDIFMSSLQRVEDNWKVSSVMKNSISLLNKNKKTKKQFNNQCAINTHVCSPAQHSGANYCLMFPCNKQGGALIWKMRGRWMFILTSANTHAVIQIITSPQTHAATMFIIQLFKHTHTEKCLKGAEYIVLKVEITHRLKHTVASGICRSV